MSEQVDVARVLQKEIERYGGNGIVNLTVRGDFDFTYYLTALLWMVPESIAITLEGDVVRIPDAPLKCDVTDLTAQATPRRLGGN